MQEKTQHSVSLGFPICNYITHDAPKDSGSHGVHHNGLAAVLPV